MNTHDQREDMATTEQPTLVRRVETRADMVPASNVGDQNSILAALGAAIDRGMSVEGIEKLTTLYERLDASRARREYAAAMARFQAECPVIPKLSTASFSTKSGMSASYKWAELNTIYETIRDSCSRHGLSFSWDHVIEGPSVACTCTVRHSGGHKESARFVAPIDGTSLMSRTQQISATLKTAMRQSLVQALGLVTGDPEPDNAPQDRGPAITASQAADLGSLLDEVGANRDKFLAYYNIDSIDQLPASCFQEAVRITEEKRKSR